MDPTPHLDNFELALRTSVRERYRNNQHNALDVLSPVYVPADKMDASVATTSIFLFPFSFAHFFVVVCLLL